MPLEEESGFTGAHGRWSEHDHNARRAPRGRCDGRDAPLELVQGHVRPLRRVRRVVRPQPDGHKQMPAGRRLEEARRELRGPPRVVAAVSAVIDVRAPPEVVRQGRRPAARLEAALRKAVAEQHDGRP